jgi:hypothetical protein
MMSTQNIEKAEILSQDLQGVVGPRVILKAPKRRNIEVDLGLRKVRKKRRRSLRRIGRSLKSIRKDNLDLKVVVMDLEK